MAKYGHIPHNDFEALLNKMGGEEIMRAFLRDEYLFVPKEKPIEQPLDFTIKVDRSIKPTYPEWMKEIMHPELELAGPAEYDLQTIQQWLHPDQKNGVVTGNTIYDQLKTDNILNDCLNLADLLAIQAKGIKVFRKLFEGKAVFAWKSVVRNQGGSLRAPYLVEHDGKVVLHWRWLDNDWDSSVPALRFSK